jgi:hypothetical protein
LQQGCQFFLDKIYQNGGKYTYQVATKSPNGRKIFQMTKWNPFPLKDPPKFTQIGILGLKIYHLATLGCSRRFCTSQHETPNFCIIQID